MANERAPYGRHADPASTQMPRCQPSSPLPAQAALSSPAGALVPYRGETYYGLPALKKSHYEWLIVDYFFVGGLAGSAQVLATAADLVGDGRYPTIVRGGRYLALAGAMASPVFLIADLHAPQRWYNMLRIFRKTSAMSIGAWTLVAFGTASGLVALGQAWEDCTGSRIGRWLARLMSLPAAGSGAMMSVYTGTLLSATAIPLWASAPRLLPALFGASSASAASAALALVAQASGAPEEEQRRLEHFELVAGAADLALATAARANWRQQQLDAPLRQEPLAAAFHLGAIGLGMVVPLAIHGYQVLTGRRSKTASTVAAVSTLAGGFLLRAAVLFAGNKSAERPRDYFQLAKGKDQG